MIKPFRPASPPPPPPPPTRKQIWQRRIQRLRPHLQSLALVSVGVLIAFLGLVAFSIVRPGPRTLTENDVNEAVARALASATPPPSIASQVYQIIQPSLVQISTRVVRTDGKSEGGRGAGVILDDNGSILTSLHVVQNAIEVRVTFYDGTESEASVVAKRPENDTAVLQAKILPDNLVPATLGNPRGLRPGDDVVAVGHPFGISNSVTAGVVSGLNRTFKPPNSGDPLRGLIQFDAAVNPGNSGGPLLNRDGEVVGIVTGLINPTDQDVFVGIGFAVPIDLAAAAAGSPPY